MSPGSNGVLASPGLGGPHQEARPDVVFFAQGLPLSLIYTKHQGPTLFAFPRALAWDESGKRIEAKPTWSATRGGPISQSGLFTPTQGGGLFRITATQGSSQAHAKVEVTANPFDYFMLDYPGIAVEDRGYNADPDGDGRTNLEEYAMGSSPEVREAYPNLLTWFRLDKFDKDASWRSYVRYQRRKDAALYGLRYELQISTNLSDWSTLDDTWRVTSVDEIFEEVSTSPRSWYIPRVFYRMKISLDE